MIEDIIKTIQEFKKNDIDAICKVLYNKYRNVTGNCLECEYFNKELELKHGIKEE